MATHISFTGAHAYVYAHVLTHLHTGLGTCPRMSTPAGGRKVWRARGAAEGTRGPHLLMAASGSAFSFINTLFIVLLRFERRSKLVVAMNIVSLVISATLILTFLVVLESVTNANVPIKKLHTSVNST